MSDWIRGQFEGSYEGRPNGSAGPGREDGLRYRVQLRGGRLREVQAAGVPAPLDLSQQRALRQAIVRHVRLDADGRGEVTLYDARLVGLRLQPSIDAGGRAYGRISGTLLARTSPPERTASAITLEPGTSGSTDNAAPANDASQALAQDAARSDAPVSAELPVPAPPSAAVGAEPPFASSDEPLPEPDSVDPVWYIVLLWLVWVGLALGLMRGPLALAVWCAVLAVAAGARKLIRRFVAQNGPVQRALGVVLVLAQLVPLIGPLDVAYKLRCLPALGPWFVLVGAVVIGTALLRGRGPVIWAGLIWTAVLFAWGSTPSGNCGSGAGWPNVFLLPGQPVPPERVDPSGRWPRMPESPASDAR